MSQDENNSQHTLQPQSIEESYLASWALAQQPPYDPQARLVAQQIAEQTRAQQTEDA